MDPLRWIKLWWLRRRTRTEAAVMGCLLVGDIYVLDIWHRIGGSSGRIYIALHRLERLGMVSSAWVEQPNGLPRMRYGLTDLAERNRIDPPDSLSVA